MLIIILILELKSVPASIRKHNPTEIANAIIPKRKNYLFTIPVPKPIYAKTNVLFYEGIYNYYDYHYNKII